MTDAEVLDEPELPSSIRVGHRDISIELSPRDDLDGAYGDYLDDKQRIRLANDRMPQSMAETLVHEILHACFPTRYSLVGDVEETIVGAIAPTLTQVLGDNPDLIAWLSHALCQ